MIQSKKQKGAHKEFADMLTKEFNAASSLKHECKVMSGTLSQRYRKANAKLDGDAKAINDYLHRCPLKRY